MTRRSGVPRALATTVDRITKPLFGRRGFAEGAVIGDWPSVVGTVLAQHTSPERIVFERGARREGILHLRVDGGGHATEIQHFEPQIVERINSYFGYRAVARLKLIQGPLPPSKTVSPSKPHTLSTSEEKDLEERLAGVDDDELKSALEGLGRAVLASRHEKSGR
jgi:hypothetical protein